MGFPLWAHLQISFLESPDVNDVIVLSTVLQEVSHKDPATYQRLRLLTTSPARRFYVFANEHHRYGAYLASP